MIKNLSSYFIPNNSNQKYSNNPKHQPKPNPTNSLPPSPCNAIPKKHSSILPSSHRKNFPTLNSTAPALSHQIQQPANNNHRATRAPSPRDFYQPRKLLPKSKNKILCLRQVNSSQSRLQTIQ